MESVKISLLVLNISIGPENNKIRSHINEYDNLKDFGENFRKKYNESRILNESQKAKINNVLSNNIHEKHLKWLNKVSAEIIFFHDKEYPAKLKKINNYPVLMYTNSVKKLKETEKSITVVGTRKATGYGRWAAQKLTRELVSKNFGIISGFAAGIDTIAHRTALETKGFTAAILPCGLDVVYPASNKELYKKIWENGLLVTEFPLGTKAFSYNFDLRNRLLSAFGDGVLVIEASENSGTMLTCNHAADQGKEVYAVPGNIDSVYSIGSNKLISEGAKIVVSVDDILEDFHSSGNETNTDYSSLDSNEKNVVAILSEGEKNILELCDRLSMDISDIYGTLTLLELNGYVIQGKGKTYRLNII